MDKHNNTDIMMLWNRIFAVKRLPNTIIMSLFLLIGIVGNVLVLFMYTLKMKRGRRDRYFIPVLAVADITACVVICVYSIFENTYSLAFPSDLLCRASWFMMWFMTSISAFVLSVIAFSRYLKICRPHEPQMTIMSKRIALLGIFAASIALSGPQARYTGSFIFNDTLDNDTFSVVTCAPGDPEQTVQSTVYFSFVFIIYIVNAVFTSFLYVAVGRIIYTTFQSAKIKRRSDVVSHMPTVTSDSHEDYEQSTVDRKRRRPTIGSPIFEHVKRQRKPETTPSDDGLLHVPTLNEPPSSDMSECVSEATENKRGDNARSSMSRNASIETLDTFSIEERVPTTNRIRRKHVKRRVRVNFNLMFLTIFILYVLSYTPSLIFLFINESNLKLWFDFRDDEVLLNVCLTLQRMLVINHIVNPFIYAYFDLTFRDKIKRTVLRRKK